MTSPQPLASAGSDQPTSPGSDMGSYADMMGVQPQQQQAPVTNNADQLRKQQQENAGMQMRALTQQLDAMAQQFPAASQDLKMAQRSLTMALVKIVGSSMPGSQPSTGAMG